MHPDLPVPRFHIGQTVWIGYVHDTQEQLPCPDCLGQRTWRVTLPSGEAHDVPCQRCTDRYSGAEVPLIAIADWKACTRQLTIGSVRIDTAAGTSSFDRHPVSYMCRETGVGSGSTYYELDVFGTEAEAFASAQAQVAQNRAKRDAQASVKVARHLALRPLVTALKEYQRSEVWSSWYAYRRLKDDIEELLAADEQPDDWRDALRDKLRFDAEYRDGHPIDTLRAEISAVFATLPKAIQDAARATLMVDQPTSSDEAQRRVVG